MPRELNLNETIVLKDPEKLKELYVYKYIRLRTRDYYVRGNNIPNVFGLKYCLKKNDIFKIIDIQLVGSYKGAFNIYSVMNEKLELPFTIDDEDIEKYFEISKSKCRNLKIDVIFN